MPVNKNPALNLKAVLQETGIAADTLRAWERRYGLPLPQRTAGGHRLYSQYDVETIKWLMARQAEGLSISRAVDLWNEHHASGTDPLAGLPQQTTTTLTNFSSDTNLETLRSHWLTACFSFNEIEAEQVLNQAFAIYPVETVCTEILQKGLSEIGEQWYENKATVQQEHFASALAMRRLDSLLSASPAPTRSETIIVGCPEHEWHTFTPLLLALLLRRRGYNVIYLGANVPSHRFEDTIKAVQAKIIILVAQQLITAATLMETSLKLSAHKMAVAFGGRVFNLHPNLTNKIAGHYLGDSIESAIGKIEVLVTKSKQSPQAEADKQEYLTATLAFESRRSHIEATLNQNMGSLGFGTEVMESAVEFLGDNIGAALRLGNVSLVDSEIDWVKNLLQAQNIPATALGKFLQLYSDAVNQNINGSGKPIFEWIKKYSG